LGSKKFYPNEFALSKKYLLKIKERMELTLDEDEAAAIALHFVNARQENEIFGNTYEITHIIDDILKIVRLHYHTDFNRRVFNFSEGNYSSSLFRATIA
jgi:beta-glucoside operon transcriptional antiterminator